ncbi:hypothetical protein L596_022823 [Steinernema carpocapsae]|uniref:Secreted protein n=1 Tax=Steinernema carpocapsae TaxID=34508 RepID=A0A4U5MNJ3_STECR|nr:hypothetical protein L596_022823 [Steinernema carpocapsae]
MASLQLLAIVRPVSPLPIVCYTAVQDATAKLRHQCKDWRLLCLLNAHRHNPVYPLPLQKERGVSTGQAIDVQKTECYFKNGCRFVVSSNAKT